MGKTLEARRGLSLASPLCSQVVLVQSQCQRSDNLGALPHPDCWRRLPLLLRRRQSESHRGSQTLVEEAVGTMMASRCIQWTLQESLKLIAGVITALAILQQGLQ